MFDPYSIGEFSFPKDFIFGSATAGHQIEGNNDKSGYYYYEQEEHAKNPEFELSGMACNSYNMYKEDIDLLTTLKHQMFRMSVEWCRIQPSEGEFDQKEVDHYLTILNMLKERGIKICISLVHMTTPRWFGKKKGFENYETCKKYWEDYLEFIVPILSPYTDMWTVLNETNCGVDPSIFPYKFDSVRYHALAYHIIKKYSKAPISTTFALMQQFARRQNDKFDLAMQNYYDMLQNEYWLHAVRTGELVIPGYKAIFDKDIKDTCDYWAVNTYVRTMIDSRKPHCSCDRYSFSKLQMTNMKFYLDMIDPECIIHNLTRLTDKPVFITENGCSCDDDDFRKIWIVEYLSAIREAMDMGVDVKGFLYWSLLDNYEWRSFKPKFGLVSVDREHDFKREIKPSAYLYREIIENKGYRPEMLKKYLKELPKIKYDWVK